MSYYHFLCFSKNYVFCFLLFFLNLQVKISKLTRLKQYDKTTKQITDNSPQIIKAIKLPQTNDNGVIAQWLNRNSKTEIIRYFT